jgi:hypothetical protein
MTTTTSVTIGHVTPTAEAIEAIENGLGEALLAMDTDQWDAAYDELVDGEIEPDAVSAFETVRDAVAAEIAPAVAQMLGEAINRRLPWTWEPER